MPCTKPSYSGRNPAVSGEFRTRFRLPSCGVRNAEKKRFRDAISRQIQVCLLVFGLCGPGVSTAETITHVFDLTGVPSEGSNFFANFPTISHDFGVPGTVVGVNFFLTYESFDPSWVSEARIFVDGAADGLGEFIVINPTDYGATNSPGIFSYADVLAPFIVSDGTVSITAVETLNDAINPDAVYAAGSFVAVTFQTTVLYGPTPYLQPSDSPFFEDIQAGRVALETFEDGQLNIPGVSVSEGMVLGPGSATDSVDADDGLIDGNGNGGNSFFATTGVFGMVFSFTVPLPTSAGIVWTDGGGIVEFEAYDSNFQSLGEFTTYPAGNDNNAGQTDEDRFFGAWNASGIAYIFIGNSIGGIEVDHLQFGGTTIVLGDVNGDGVVNLLDVAPFVAVITGGTFIPAADINGDGVANLLDVAPFVTLLTG